MGFLSTQQHLQRLFGGDDPILVLCGLCHCNHGPPPGGIQAALKPRYPILQILRGTILAIEICVMVTAFTILG